MVIKTKNINMYIGEAFDFAKLIKNNNKIASRRVLFLMLRIKLSPMWYGNCNKFQEASFFLIYARKIVMKIYI